MSVASEASVSKRKSGDGRDGAPSPQLLRCDIPLHAGHVIEIRDRGRQPHSCESMSEQVRNRAFTCSDRTRDHDERGHFLQRTAGSKSTNLPDLLLRAEPHLGSA